MNRSFLIADTHIGHRKIIEFEPELRPFDTVAEHDEELVRRWNSVVNKKDTVWHLGDVLFGREAFNILGRLNGYKRLVLGNHDRYSMELYTEHFTSIHGSVELHGFVLTHIPVHPSQFTRYKGNIHGHLHSKKIDDPRYICVCAEHINLTPISFTELTRDFQGC